MGSIYYGDIKYSGGSSTTLSELTDVTLASTVNDDDSLTYNTTSGKWTNEARMKIDGSNCAETVSFEKLQNGGTATASGDYSHAEGTGFSTGGILIYTEASGTASHAEGKGTLASGNSSHSEGIRTTASGYGSHAEGYYTTAAQNYQHVNGKYNDNKTNTLFEIGYGTAQNARLNVFEVYNDGSLSTDNGTTKIKLENVLTQHQDISGKADKVTSATNGNFAGLDSNGNLTDSGKKSSDFAASSHTHTRSQITDFPTLGTASALDVPTSGNASTTQVVKGDDTRLKGKSAFYGTCDTEASTAAKVVTCAEFAETDLVAGTVIAVKFTNNNTATDNITLSVNNTTAKTVSRFGTTTGSMNIFSWISGQVVLFIYDGTYWQMVYIRSASTSAAGLVTLSTSTSSTSTTSAATPSAVKAAYDLANGKANPSELDDWVATASVSSGAFSVTVDDTQGYAYKPYFVIDGNSTNLNPSYELASMVNPGTASCTLNYTTDANNGTNNVKIRRIK